MTKLSMKIYWRSIKGEVMTDLNIINDAELLEKAKEHKRIKSREYNKAWRRKFKEQHGIDYDTYIIMRKLKKGD